MTMWLIATANKVELDVQEQLDVLGLQCAVPRRVDLIRQGKRRRPDAVISAYLPGYAFGWFGPEDWHAVREAKHVRNIMGITPQEERSVRAFIDRVEADFAKRMAQIEAGERVSQYEPGDLLQIMAPGFGERLARFSHMIQQAHDMFPTIVADVEGFGGVVRMNIDPIAVRRAAE